MSRKIFSLLTGLSACLSLMAQDVFISTDSTETPEVALGEVVISASRNNSQLKKLPSSISIISSRSLKNNQVTTMDQITGIAPGFVMPDYGSKLTSPVYIRGVGSRINSPSVGLYVDNVPYFEKASFNFDFFDIERIEVLRGPQGTLYGRNSMGGLINIKTLSPMDYQGTKLKLSAGNYGLYNVNVGHYQKTGERFAYSLSANYNHNDGFFTNKYFDEKIDDMNSIGLKNRLIFKVNKHLIIENIVGLEDSKQGGYPYAIYNDSLARAEDINYNQTSSYDRFMFSDGLKLTYSQPKWELTSTFSYQLLDDEQRIDQDFTSDSLYFIVQKQRQDMVSGEVLLRSKGSKKYNYLFGVFGFNQQFDRTVDVDVYSSNMWYSKGYDLNVSSLGVFHQSTYKPIENLTITAGLRYDSEVSELDYSYHLKMAGNTASQTDTIYPKLKDDIFLPKVAVSYQLNEINFYLSYAKGYKPGGYNSTFERPEHLMFKNETSLNYEAGIKSSVFNRKLYADLAVFFTELEGQQIYRTVPSGRGSYLDNAGSSENKGVELTLKNSPALGFEAMLTYGYTHSKIIKYEKDAATNYNGNYTPYIPRHTLAASITKTFVMNNISFVDRIAVNLLYRNMGELYWNLDNSYKQEQYGILDARVSFMYKSFGFDIWGKNLTETEYNAFLFEALGRTYVQTNKPLQVGINLSYNF